MKSGSLIDSFLIPGLLAYAAGDVAVSMACANGSFGRVAVELILILLALSVAGLIATGVLWWKRRAQILSRSSLVGAAAIFGGLIAFHVMMLDSWTAAT